MQRPCTPCDSNSIFWPQQSDRSLCDSSSVLRMPAPVVSSIDTCSVERKAIQRKKPIVRSPPALSLTVGNVSLSVVGSLVGVHCSPFLLLQRQCLKFKSFSLPLHCIPFIILSYSAAKGSLTSELDPSLSHSSIQVIPVFIYNSPNPSIYPAGELLPMPDSIPPPVHCSCSRTHCLKLYCDCFKAGQPCSSQCGCVDCLNKVSHPEREHALLRLRMKSKGKMHRVVTPSCCACKNSTCKKKYCSCYRLGKLCSDSCRCVNCHNRM